MENKIRKYPLFSVCGLNCGLCPRYYTAGLSRCPGCAGEGFSNVHPPCGILSCCRRKDYEYCFECGEFPCGKYDEADTKDSFITHINQFTDMEKAKNAGMAAYEKELNEKVKILGYILKSFDDGRHKSFYCLAVNLLELKDIKATMGRMENEIPPDSTQKEKAKACAGFFKEIAEKRNITLKLRK